MEHETSPQPRLGLSISEAAGLLGVSLSTVRRWSDAGVLPSYRTPGGQRRFSTEQLDDFIVSLESGAPMPQAPEPDTADEPTFTAGSVFRDPPPAPAASDNEDDAPAGGPRFGF